MLSETSCLFFFISLIFTISLEMQFTKSCKRNLFFFYDKREYFILKHIITPHRNTITNRCRRHKISCSVICQVCQILKTYLWCQRKKQMSLWPGSVSQSSRQKEVGTLAGLHSNPSVLLITLRSRFNKVYKM